MHFIFEVRWFCLVVCVFYLHSVGAYNGLRPLFLSKKLENKIESENSERPAIVRTVPSPPGEVQHDIVMYWTERFLDDPGINIVLKGSNSQTESINLQQNTVRTGLKSMARAKPMVYRVMIKPVPGLDSALVSSNGTLPNFDKILIVTNNNLVYEFLPTVPSKPTLPANQASKETKLVYEYPAVSIRFAENGRCINPLDSTLPPLITTRLVLRYNCRTLDAFFIITQNQSIQHIASGLYIDGDISSVGVVLPVNGGDVGHYQPDINGVGGVNGGNFVNQQPDINGVGGVNGGNIGDQQLDKNNNNNNNNGGTSNLSPDGIVNDGGGDGELASSNQGDNSALDSSDGYSNRKFVGNGHYADYSRLVDKIRPSSNQGVANIKPASIGHNSRPSMTEQNDGDPKLADMNDELVTTVNDDKENKMLGGEDIATMNTPPVVGKKLGGMHSRLTPHLSALYKDFPNRRLSSGLNRYQRLRSHPLFRVHSQSRPIIARALVKDYNKRSGITLRTTMPSKFVNLYLKLDSNLKFQFTSDPKKATSNESNEQDSTDILPEGAEGLETRNSLPHAWNVRMLARRNNEDEFKRQDVLRGNTAKARNRRTKVTGKSYLQEKITRLCIGYRNKRVVLMPCDSVPSSVQFYGKSGNTPPTKTIYKPITDIQNKTVNKTVPVAVAEPPYNPPAPVVNQCGTSCPSTCGPSCTQSCCSTGGMSSYAPSNSGSCGSECPSSCSPSCTSSCCNTGYQGSQGTLGQGMSSSFGQGMLSSLGQGMSSSLSSCPSSCSSAQTCPSSQCPQSCCSGQGGGQGGSSMSQVCPSSCKRVCRSFCPFNCC